jgi:16S rRNA (cytosine1407-C5)-methyltransferase
MNQNAAFEAHYRALYGSRWAELRESLLAPARAVPYDEGLVRPYMLDYASVLAARSLRLSWEAGIPREAQFPPGTMFPVEAGPPAAAEILDACAAPGGKTLVIAGRMGEGKLLANEFSTERRRRLQAVLDEHLGPEKRALVRVSGFDAAAAGARRGEWGRFDGILLDAPCSSERHVLGDPTALGRWTPARPRFLARRQWSLLSAAFLLLKPGGSLVYATCALDPRENDGVVRRLFEKYGAPLRETAKGAAGKEAATERIAPGKTAVEGTLVLDRPDFAEGEATEYGRIILPDRAGGMGPLYVARFFKRTGDL